MNKNDQYSLNWSNHTSHIKKAFDTLLAENEFVDVTLTCEGKKVSAHKVVLSACSAYFHDLFRENPCQHPIVILRDVKYQNLMDILKFMYNGEVSVSTQSFDSFLKTAELLQVSGLTDDDNRYVGSEKEGEAQSTPSLLSEQFEPVTTMMPVRRSLHSFENLMETENAKRRLTEGNTAEDKNAHKKRKDLDLKPDIEIKQEIEDEEEEEMDLKDPLEIRGQSQSDAIDILQPAGSQKFSDVQDLLSDEYLPSGSRPAQLKRFRIAVPLLQPICAKPLNSDPPALVTHHRPTLTPTSEMARQPPKNCQFCSRLTLWKCMPCGNIPLHKECFENYHARLLMRMGQ